ncbi:MAG: c-type cytochrome [Candidatus Binatia bacterium]
MARRTDTNIDDEKRSYGAVWLVLSLFLFVSGLWAVADDNVFRRPWKKFQTEFNHLDIQRVKDQIAEEQKRLDALPEYQEAKKTADAARADVESGGTSREIARLEREIQLAREADQNKDLNLRFVKAELEELRFQYDDAHHAGRPTSEIQAKIDEKEVQRAERQAAYGASQAGIEAIESQIKEKRSALKKADEALAKLTTGRDELQQKLENIALGYFPGPKATPPFFGYDWQPKIPKIQQIVLEEFDRNNFNQPIARVDRCTTCHLGINKAGFEEQPNPFRTHPRRDLLLGKHDPDKFGCTPCHEGEGPDVNGPERAHGNFYVAEGEGHEKRLETVEFQDRPMFRAEKMQVNCIKCHASVQNLEGAEVSARGERLFVELGCHGCHLVDGYEELAKEDGFTAIGPSLRRIGAKVDRGWLVRWITNPHQFRARTRMPNFMFDEQQATQVAAWLLAQTKEPSDAWAGEHAAPASLGDVARGKELVESIGCRACHALSPDEVAGQIGANKDIAPNLSSIAEKTDARWMYHWIRNPRGWSSVARMPSLRVSDDEARAIVAYLSTLGTKKPVPAGLEASLADPANVAAGEKLARKYGCAGCHDIPGWESEPRVGAELSSFGQKTKEELFFGDRTDLQEDWDTWTYNKLLTPRTYATKWIEQAMPQFDLADEDVKALRVFLASRTDTRVPAKYVYKGVGDKQIVDGRRLVARYNCTGCHVIEGHGGDIRRLYEDAPNMAPPILNGEGEKVQASWFFNFLKAPSPIRPWLKLRMPTFGLDDVTTHGIVSYFGALDKVTVPFVHIDRAEFRADSVEAGKLLATKDYFACFSCHQRGAEKPEGPPEGWAPDLGMAAARLGPQWIVKWLRDPQKVMPGTKMPSFYTPDADGKLGGGPDDVLGGDAEAQMRALRDYVISIGLPNITPPSPSQAAGVTSAGPGATL